jgi:hypothetical protein
LHEEAADMAVTEESRHQLYTRLESVLGPQEATVLMEHLPPIGWADVATKRDLEIVEARLEARFERSLRDLQRNLFFGIVTMQTAFLGIVLAVVR